MKIRRFCPFCVVPITVKYNFSFSLQQFNISNCQIIFHLHVFFFTYWQNRTNWLMWSLSQKNTFLFGKKSPRWKVTFLSDINLAFDKSVYCHLNVTILYFKTLWSLFADGVQLSQGYSDIKKRRLTFTISPK